MDPTTYRHQRSSEYGNLSYYTLLDPTNTDYGQSLAFGAQKGFALDTTNTYIRTNIALSYLLSGQFKRAEDYYTRWKDQWYNNNGSYLRYGATFLDDLGDAKRLGILKKCGPEVRARRRIK